MCICTWASQLCCFFLGVLREDLYGRNWYQQILKERQDYVLNSRKVFSNYSGKVSLIRLYLQSKQENKLLVGEIVKYKITKPLNEIIQRIIYLTIKRKEKQYSFLRNDREITKQNDDWFDCINIKFPIC